MKVSNPRAGEPARKEAEQAYCPSWPAVGGRLTGRLSR